MWSLNTHNQVSQQTPNLPNLIIIHKLRGIMVNKGRIHKEFKEILKDLFEFDQIGR